MARRGAGFDMKVIYYDAYRRQDLEQQFGYQYRDSLETVLGEADFVSLHTPLTDETRHLMNAQRLAMMKPTARSIPPADRSSIPRPCIRPSRPAPSGPGLDVTEPEPLPVGDPLLTLQLPRRATHRQRLGEHYVTP